MTDTPDIRQLLEAANEAASFHRLTGFRIKDLREGKAEVEFPANAEMLNHVGAIHAGVQCAALDIAAGYAAATLAGPVVTMSLTTQFLSSARGERFRATAAIVKQGKTNLFAEARLFADDADGGERLISTATAVLTRVAG